ncbi:MAG: LPS-assembly protein LptD, partial [Phycisphaerales bacterium]|nr:LPS-assembly protein LptD [Phycisphaerales bacterium]
VLSRWYQRGFVDWQHRQYLPEDWELSLEFGYASDPMFLDSLFRDLGASDKQWETSAYLKKQQDDWAFTVLTSYDINDFTTQATTLQSPGYVVDKLPEIGYHMIGTSFWEDRLTYFGETRLSRMQITPGNDNPAQRGFTNLQSINRFGIPLATTSFANHVENTLNIPTDWRYRVDTRHEVAAPVKLGTINATPYVVGRVTAYDNDFQAFAGEDDQVRLMGQVGTRFHTQFSATYDQVESSVLNLHRMRHILEPRVDVFHIYSSYNPEDIPVYDDDVEGLSEGSGIRWGMRNTLQTQRGGPGQWRDVDWMVLDTDLVHRSGDAPTNAAIARYFGYRPEYSLGGNHFYSNLLWSITDHLASVVEIIHNFDSNQLASAGRFVDASGPPADSRHQLCGHRSTGRKVAGIQPDLSTYHALCPEHDVHLRCQPQRITRSARCAGTKNPRLAADFCGQLRPDRG